MGAIAFFTGIGAGVDLAAFHTVVNHLGLARDDALFVFVIGIDPQPKEQQEACAHIEQKEDINFECDHVTKLKQCPYASSN